MAPLKSIWESVSSDCAKKNTENTETTLFVIVANIKKIENYILLF